MRRNEYDEIETRHRKKRNDDLLNNNKKLDRLGRLTYLWAKRAQGKK